MSAYYNENDPFAAAWLRNLIAEGLVAPGDVDERDIRDVKPTELDGYGQHHFFAGIGGWSRALRLAGWPDDRPVWTGSCPCQPFSAAGRRKGANDERHLWPYWRWIIDQRRPAVVFGEQVASKDGRGWLAGVRVDLEAMGHAVGAADLCAAGEGAPHIRQRLFWVAYAASARRFGEVKGSEGETRDEARVLVPSEHGATGGLADSDGGLSGNGHLQSGGQHGQQPQDGGAGGVGDPRSNDLGRVSGGAPRAQKESQGSGEINGASGVVSRPASAIGRLGDADSARLQGRTLEELQGTGRRQKRSEARRAGGSFWSNFDLTPCADGKARRIESGTFPLAHGVPNRVGLLRGYGNAINPYVAATFIEESGLI